MKTLAILITFFFVATNTGLASTYSAQCLNKKGKFSSCNVAVDENTVNISYKTKVDKEMDTVIQGKDIKSLSAGEYARRRIGEAVGTAVFTFGIGLLVALSKKKRDHIGIEYLVGANKAKGVLIQMPKKFGMALKQELVAVSGKKFDEMAGSVNQK